MESIKGNHDIFAMVTAKIMTKSKGMKRFKVYTELKNALIDGYYLVEFKEVNE